MSQNLENLVIRIFSLDRKKKRVIQITFDFTVISISFLLAFALRLESLQFLLKKDFYLGVSILLVTTLIVFLSRGLYSTFTRHLSVETALTIMIGAAISALTLLAATFLLELQIPRSVPMIYAGLLYIISTGARFYLRSLGQSVHQKNRKNAIIYGAGTAGVQLFNALKSNEHYKVRRFIDDNPELHGQKLAGIPIFGVEAMRDELKSLNIDTIFLAVPTHGKSIQQKVLSLLSEHPLKVKAIPSISNLILGATGISNLKDIDIEDLLGRQSVKPDDKLMAKSITQKTILITGAGGSIGSELCKQISQWAPRKLILLDVSEFSIYQLLQDIEKFEHSVKLDIVPLVGSFQDNDFVSKIFDQFDIDTVFHAGAYKHVPIMESNVMQCIANNVFGTLNLVEHAIAKPVKNFILISTDKAVNPTNIMGASKRIAEIICQTLPIGNTKTCFSIVRFGNVLGSSGSVVPLFKTQIANGGPITLTHPEVTRYFMTISEAARLVIDTGSLGQSSGLFVLDMGIPVKILDLAKKMATLSGLSPVLDNGTPINADEILITITGLRPGEKLYEELSYSGELLETTHPHIMKADESPMALNELQKLLSDIREAIKDDDYKKLLDSIKVVANDITNITSSDDAFLKISNVKSTDTF